MRRLSQHVGKSCDLSTSCQQQLNSYALAAAAAGVGLLALAERSEAEIIYTPTHHVIGDRGSYRLDFTGDGTTDLTIQNKYFYSCTWDGSCWTSDSLAAKMAGNNQAVHNFFGAAAMTRGMRIGSKCSFGGGLETMAHIKGPLSHSSSATGSWINVKNRYLGVKFKIKGQTHYGWARLSVLVKLPLTITGTLTGYAYETIPNKAIIAGKTKGADVITMDEPGSLGRLAQGSLGTASWLQKESTVGVR